MMPDARMVVRRNNGGIEADPGTDPYPLMVAQAHGTLKALGRFDRARVHSRHVCAFVADGTPGKAQLSIESTVVAPTDPILGGALLFAGLLAFKKHAPQAFAEGMRRLRDAGLTAGGL